MDHLDSPVLDLEGDLPSSKGLTPNNHDSNILLSFKLVLFSEKIEWQKIITFNSGFE